MLSPPYKSHTLFDASTSIDTSNGSAALTSLHVISANLHPQIKIPLSICSAICIAIAPFVQTPCTLKPLLISRLFILFASSILGNATIMLNICTSYLLQLFMRDKKVIFSANIVLIPNLKPESSKHATLLF